MCMKKIANYLIFVLCAFLPIQNSLILFITNRLKLSSALSLWKEVLVLIISSFFIFEITKYFRSNENKLSFKDMWPLLIFAGLAFIAILDLVRITLPLWILGFRFELAWLGFFSLAVVWLKTVFTKYSFEEKKHLKSILKWGIIAGFCLSSVFSLSSLAIGQEKFLEFFGYGGETANYIVKAPVGHVIDFGDNNLRLSGPFSTPNHYAGYLLLMLGFFLNLMYKSRNYSNKLGSISCIVLCVLFIYLSYARFAWLAVVCIVAWLGWLKIKQLIQIQIDKSKSKQNLVMDEFAHSNKKIKSRILAAFNYLVLGLILITPVFIGLVVINTDLSKQTYLPNSILKPSSTDLHRRHFLASTDVLFLNPTNYLVGFGLGSSGPAAKIEYGYLNESPIVKYHYKYASKWFIDNADLVIPENWFLQVWLNGGILYLIGYLSIFLIPIWKLKNKLSLQQNLDSKPDYDSAWSDTFFALSYFGIFIGSLFLHILENQTVAIMWTLVFIYWQISQFKEEQSA